MQAKAGIGLMEEVRVLTPSDTDIYNSTFPASPRGDGTPANRILVGTAGAVKVRLHGRDPVDANDITTPILAAGVWHDMPPFIHIFATGTTPTSVMVGLKA